MPKSRFGVGRTRVVIAAVAATVSACAAHTDAGRSADPSLDSLIDDTGGHLVGSMLPYPFNFQSPNGSVCTESAGHVENVYFCHRRDRWVSIGYVHDGFALGPAKWINPQRDWHPPARAGTAPVDLADGHRLTLSEQEDAGGSTLVCGVPDPTRLTCRLRSDNDHQYRSTRPPVPVEHGFVLSSTGADRAW